MRVRDMMILVDGLGWGVRLGLRVGVGWWEARVWCCDSEGRAVDILIQRFSTYLHTIPIQHTARHTPFSPPSKNSHPPYQPYLPCLQPTQLHSRTNSNPTYSTRSSTISTALRTLSHPRHTLPLPTRHIPTPQPQQIYPTIHTPHIIVPSKPLYAHPAAKTRISPSRARKVNREVLLCLDYWVQMRHDTSKRVFNSFRPGQTQIGLCSHTS